MISTAGMAWERRAPEGEISAVGKAGDSGRAQTAAGAGESGSSVERESSTVMATPRMRGRKKPPTLKLSQREADSKGGKGVELEN